MKITRWIVLFVIIISAPAIAKAQYRPYTFGFKAAPGIGWVRTDTKEYTGGSSINFSWGFVTEFNFTENHCVATGINFQFINGKITYPDVRNINGTDQNVPVVRKLRVKYLQIPFTLKMRTEEQNNMRFFGQFGLGTGFRLSAKGIDEYSFSGGTISESDNIDGDVSFFRESLIVGLGMEYRISSGNMMSFGLTFDNGFTNILSWKNKVGSDKPKGTSSLIEMSVGIMF
ncbi:MAG TPA: porin family protein [Bacteroidales bacterium]